jgi:hypothetical protein
MKVAHSRAKIESKQIVRHRQYRQQDSDRKTNRESGRYDNPWQKHGGQGPRGIHCAYSVRRYGFQSRSVNLEPKNRDHSQNSGDDRQTEFGYHGSSQKIVAETNTDNSSDNVVCKIMREEPETEPSNKSKQHIYKKRSDPWQGNKQSHTYHHTDDTERRALG